MAKTGMFHVEHSGQPVEKVQRKLGFFAFMWYNIGEGS